jgi:hypothetical protein
MTLPWAASVNIDQESKHFLACVECGLAVMGTLAPSWKKKLISTSRSKARLKLTYCGKCDMTDMIKKPDTFDDSGVRLSINRRMIETWYVYRALMKYVGGNVELNEDNDTPTTTIRLINKDEFIHPRNGIYELTTINIHPDNPEDAFVKMSPHLVYGFF